MANIAQKIIALNQEKQKPAQLIKYQKWRDPRQEMAKKTEMWSSDRRYRTAKKPKFDRRIVGNFR